MDADLTIARLAATQHGVVTRNQLLTAGVSPRAVEHRLERRVLVAVHAGIYRMAGANPTWRQRIMAATLAGGPTAAASHRAAAWLHGLAGVEPRAEMSVARGRSPRPAGVTVHRLLGLAARDVERRDGIPCMRPAVTLIAIAAVVSELLLEAALDDALARGLVSVAQLERRLVDLGRHGRRGTLTLSPLLAVRGGGPRWTQSEFERRLLRLVEHAGLPPLVRQFEVRLPGGRRAFIDLAWPELRLGLEAHSFRHHSSRSDWSRDNTRNNLVTSLGWRILPVTWDDMIEHPDDLVHLLWRARAA